jgi:hypothetical protein
MASYTGCALFIPRSLFEFVRMFNKNHFCQTASLQPVECRQWSNVHGPVLFRTVSNQCDDKSL